MCIDADSAESRATANLGDQPEGRWQGYHRLVEKISIEAEEGLAQGYSLHMGSP